MPRQTAVARARWSARHSSARNRANARPESAPWTGSAPAPAPAPARNVRLPRSLRCSLRLRRALRRARRSRGFCITRLRAVIVFPVTLLLQRVRDILGHIGLVMLGEHGVGPEHAGGVESALGDHALPFAKQIGKNARVGNRQRGAAVAD